MIDSLPPEKQDLAYAVWALTIARARIQKLCESLLQSTANSIPAEDPELPSPESLTNRVYAQKLMKLVYLGKQEAENEISILEARSKGTSARRAISGLSPMNPNGIREAQKIMLEQEKDKRFVRFKAHVEEICPPVLQSPWAVVESSKWRTYPEV
jgi:hypothetical protein